ncbi:FkbM family methyltransferase [Muricauda sp. SCSIO 64092]|uniref:FkbM family methyltransferase n=1 Tax=Allomuricauda sp. SCSIO 64092 TaxID=2908842 RepID=UPI001FF29A0B|nr:FkbM family methyltransferase [Muricauda sp. SCSIO 64092]UOY08498.1 FkbM family methyltransferase [Muricauda sp. SCSIO 64092]
MLKYIKQSIRRKKARRITKEYPYRISEYNLEQDGIIQFANWENPLVNTITITQSEVNFFRKFINQGDFVIDIGANIGDTTVPIALAAGKEGVTLGVDPNPYVFKLLEVNASLNKEKTNIIPMLNAISTEDRDYYYISSEASFANGGISPTKDSKHGKFVYPNKVKGINLLGFLNKNYRDLLNKLSFIKIDTEGYDKEIVKSITDLLLAHKPVIIVESFGKSPDEAKEELFEVINKNGYRLFYFEDFKDKTNIQEITIAKAMTNWRHTINIYALPNEKVDSSGNLIKGHP